MRIRIEETSQVGEARRAAASAAAAQHLSETIAGRVAVVVTEMATNLVKHAGGGDFFVESFDDADGRGIELMTLDKGPGIGDIARCLGDGYSTAGSAGTGLGAISRMADSWDVYSRPGQGTVLMARIRSTDMSPQAVRKTASKSVQIGVATTPYPGEYLCGDAWAFGAAAATTTDPSPSPALLVADGLGHGPAAAEAGRIAAGVFAAHGDEDGVALVTRVHRALAATRGAALAMARIDERRGLIRYIGVGNIAGAFVSEGVMRKMASNNGTAGHLAPRIKEFTYPFVGKPLLILHSDGLSARWDIAAYAGLSARHPSVIAGVVYRDQQRGRDDACVVVMRPVGEERLSGVSATS